MENLRRTGPRAPLRAQLQAGTRAIHDQLDRSLENLEFSRPADYARFLAQQLEARDAIEEWADRDCPALLRPPSTTFLLRQDLAELARDFPLGSACAERGSPGRIGRFVLPEGADPLGLAWAIAGSHMGNRAILARLRKAAVGAGPAELPRRFLADTRMTGFWHRLLPRLQDSVTPDQAEPALAAARAVFARFEQVFARDGARGRQAA